MPGTSESKSGWPGTKNGESHRVWLPKRAQAIVAELSKGETHGVIPGPAWTSGRSAR